MVSRASPVRTCVGCRSRAPAFELLRVVAVKHMAFEHMAVGNGAEPLSRKTSGEAVFSVEPDPDRRQPGRGAHLHPDPTCLAMAERRRAFGRALRVAGVVDTGPLSEFVRRSKQPMVGPPTPDQQGRTTDMSTR